MKVIGVIMLGIAYLVTRKGRTMANNVEQCRTRKFRPAYVALLGYSEKDCRLEMVDLFATGHCLARALPVATDGLGKRPTQVTSSAVLVASFRLDGKPPRKKMIQLLQLQLQ